MDENDLKYLISAYQSKSADLLTQLIVSESKNLKLQNIIETLNKKNQELESKLNSETNTTTSRSRSSK